jgi:hypothetical protein
VELDEPTTEVELAEDRADRDEGAAQRLRSLGYIDGPGDSIGPSARAASPPKESLAKLSRKAPDSGALSELDYRNAQNLNQRANEALDYLGPQSDDVAPLRASRIDRGQAARGASSIAEPSMRARQKFAASSAGLEEVRQLHDQSEAHVMGKRVASGAVLPESRDLLESKHEANAPGRVRGPAPLTPAQRFRRERRQLEKLAFQPSSGYWANTYVPGDPVLRWLESRLEERDRASLQAFAHRPLLLEGASRQTSQPFDPPGNAALAVFVQADRRGLEHEERMLVQVGLQGAHRRSGLRPAMSVGVVLDARGALSGEDGASVRALLQALLAASDVGDRFSLTVAGRPGGQHVGPDEFRHGPLTLAMSQLFEPSARSHTSARSLRLVEALEQTTRALQQGDDPEAPLGSSMVLLVTSQPLGGHTDELVRLAHQSAVAGIPVSVVAVGGGADLDEIERVSLAGQGNRRLLPGAAEAKGVVDRELSALSRVIARALRLNIRLAPGVSLVEVIGADRLDAAGAQRVRNAEQSIDSRLSRNLGIERDRGEDEDGIQIVIPTFHSGDAHAVLLDVVAKGPGPIADVTIRYKDLVYLRNSVARSNLTLARDAAPPGPLELNVVKNYLAVRLASDLKQAGRSLLEGGDAETIAMVRDFRALLDSLRAETPSFRNDPELATDSAMLGEYLALLETGVLDDAEPRRYLADSLQLSGYFKTVPRSTSVARTARR